MRPWRALLNLKLAPARIYGGRSYCAQAAAAAALALTEQPSFGKSIEGKQILVRDYLRSALYDPTFGYFARHPDVVGVLPEALDFKRFSGRRDFSRFLSEIYKQSDASWFTPVELFQPWYGYAMAEYILQTMNPQHPLKIYEIGGGTGTCASNILDYIRVKDPKVYETMSYTSVEASDGLAKKQHQRLCVEEEHDKFNVECRNASDRSGWGSRREDPCYVIMLEVLDNTPHDLLYKENRTSPWLETYVQYEPRESKIVERHRLIQDSLNVRCLHMLEKGNQDYATIRKVMGGLKNAFSKVFPMPVKMWIPTGCVELMDTLHYALPEMVLVASDFSSLPDIKVPGIGAPIVSSKSGGINTDHSSYLDAMGDADIFFATNFGQLQLIDNECAFAASDGRFPPNKQGIYRGSAILKSEYFLSRFGYVNEGKTRDGYNPMLELYSNTRVYLSAPSAK